MEAPRSLIEPQKSRKDPSLPPHALLVFTPHDLHACLSLLDGCWEKPHRLFLSDVMVGWYGGTQTAVLGPMLGAPQAVLVLEKAMALGVRRVIAFGWCGSLQPHVAIGDVILPTEGYSEEGTSAHYPVEEPVAPSPSLMKSLRSSLCVAGLTVHEGKVWSTDAPYRETEGKVRAYQARGALGVEMEMAALLTVAAFRRIDLAGALVVSDDLSRLVWRHGFRDPRFLQARKVLPGRLLEALTAESPSGNRSRSGKG